MDGNPKTPFGLAKPGMHAVPPLPLLAVAQVMAVGKQKYGHYNWRKTGVCASVYYDAALRHLFAWQDGQDTDTETGLSHLALAAANLFILIDAESGPWLIDDRNEHAGFTNEFISENTTKIAKDSNVQAP